MYVYVENNPTNFTDPTGYYCVSKDGMNAHPGKCAGSTTSVWAQDKNGQVIVKNGYLIGFTGDIWGEHYYEGKGIRLKANIPGIKNTVSVIVGPGKGGVFDSNQWTYLTNLAKSGKDGAEWANEQIKKEQYYKATVNTEINVPLMIGSTYSIPAGGLAGGAAISGGLSLARAIGVASLALLVSIGGSEAEFEKERRNTVYRALTKENAASLLAGKGIIAKNPAGKWTPFEHIMKGSQQAALVNDPWISTTKSLKVARGYDSGNGIVAIDLRKVKSRKVDQTFQYKRRSQDKDEVIAYNRAVWSQEISVYQYIQQGAIIGYVK